MNKPVDPSRCPLCGQANQCAQCAPDASQPCWCFSASIAPQARERIPPQLRDRACLCSRCARGDLPAAT